MTTWVSPCPDCGFVEHNINGAMIGPIWEEKGSECPKCKRECKIKLIGQGGPNYHAEVVEA